MSALAHAVGKLACVNQAGFAQQVSGNAGTTGCQGVKGSKLNLLCSHGLQALRKYAGMVPIVIEQTSRGERAYDIYSRLLKVRVPSRRPPLQSFGRHDMPDGTRTTCIYTTTAKQHVQVV
jgi:hypothetical protein